ncbi:hypothetical protein THRCLA_02415 [Thraustotheca clavata]|uniref:Uncharacterized protein n=1 Tax=Thraustotheca clavata TaxID=74557 RepID=A0A1W0A5A3_9STRA|nr:hypothetical protein THRCLA_02415 [Thraustotheca clavata]
MAQNYIAQKRPQASSKEAAAAHRQASDNSPSEGEDSAAEDEAPTQPRGKQLRFPMPVASTEGSDEDSDDYASLSSSDSSDSDDEDGNEQNEEKDPQYIILGARALKRVRPSNDYYKSMAAYVRGCLLLVRERKKTELKEEDHAAFRKALAENKIERVVIADTPVEIPKPEAEDKPKKKDKKKKDGEKKKSKKQTESPVKKASSTPPPAKVSSTPPPVPVAVKAAPVNKVTTEVKPKPAEVVEKPAPEKKKIEEKPQEKKKIEEKVQKPVAQEKELKRAASDESEQPQAKKQKVSAGQFSITTTADMSQMRSILKQVEDLNKEGVSLKHLGDRKENEVAQGLEYLKASAKFLRQALLLSDLKAICKQINDPVKAGKWGKDSISTLGQTAALIESTIGMFKRGGNRRLAAVSYKFFAIVQLTSYRLQHNMLYAYYSQLNIPGRSPDGGVPMLSPDQEGIRRLILREMGSLMRGFDFWRYYEATGESVMPEITDPTTVDFEVLWTALDREITQA